MTTPPAAPYPYEQIEQPPYKRNVTVAGKTEPMVLAICTCGAHRKGPLGGVCQTCGKAIPQITTLPPKIVAK